MKKRIALGMMSGTSVDAIDASLVLTGTKSDHLLLHLQFPYPKELQKDILQLVHSQNTSLSELTRLHYAVGIAFADAAEQTIRIALKKKFLKKREDLKVIGAHGQTVFHHPEAKRTLQIGEGSQIAVRTGVTTVSDFRVADTAALGEGAPLLPAYHQRLFHKKAKKGVAVHNLGGISNFTYLGPKGKIFALDTGPANCLLDLAVHKFTNGSKAYDESGKWARSGKIHSAMLEFLMNDKEVVLFRKRPAPKSTGRELFSLKLLNKALEKFPTLSHADVLATLVAYSVELMAEAYNNLVLKAKLPLSEIIVCGGGASNQFLVESLGQRFPKADIQSMEDYAFSSQALESQAFAAFALNALDGESISHPETTGAREAVVSGKISPGKNWKKI